MSAAKDKKLRDAAANFRREMEKLGAYRALRGRDAVSIFGHPDQDADVREIEEALQYASDFGGRGAIERRCDDGLAALARLATRLDEQEKALRSSGDDLLRAALHVGMWGESYHEQLAQAVIAYEACGCSALPSPATVFPAASPPVQAEEGKG